MSEAATITANDPGVQLLLRRQSADGTVKDLTGLAAWRVDPPGFGAIEAGGYLRPLAAGKVGVKVVFEGQEVAAPINVEPRENRSWDFASDVVPILTRLGCNWREGRAGFNGSDGCRSKAGQEKLSMDSGNSSQPESVANDN